MGVSSPFKEAALQAEKLLSWELGLPCPHTLLTAPVNEVSVSPLNKNASKDVEENENQVHRK